MNPITVDTEPSEPPRGTEQAQTATTDRINVQELFCDLQDQMYSDLKVTRRHLPDSTTKGDAAEVCWIEMLRNYLPKRYCVEKAQVIDSDGNLSQQIDIVIFDRQYSPFMLNHNRALYVPAESIYAVLEVKPTINAGYIKYAQDKAQSVRRLYRTNMPIVHAGGRIQEPKPPFRILSGILAPTAEWVDGLGSSFDRVLGTELSDGSLDIGCCLEHGGFVTIYDDERLLDLIKSAPNDALIFFFMNLVAKLQALGTVPAIDVLAYTRFITTKNNGGKYASGH